MYTYSGMMDDYTDASRIKLQTNMGEAKAFDIIEMEGNYTVKGLLDTIDKSTHDFYRFRNRLKKH